MKYPAAFTKSLLMAASIGMVAPMFAQTPAVKPAKPVTPAKPATPPPAEEVPVVDGLEIKRTGGGFLGLKLDGAKLVLKAYDADKKPAELGTVVRATARWSPVNKTGDERAVLNPDGSGALVSPAVVRPPYTFRLFLTLLDASGNAVESHVVDMRQLNAEKP